MTPVADRHGEILAAQRLAALKQAAQLAVVMLVCLLALWATGFFDAERLVEGGLLLLSCSAKWFRPISAAGKAGSSRSPTHSRCRLLELRSRSQFRYRLHCCARPTRRRIR
jgi:hypothetical protein